jgi:CMP-N,N'-diacetyllegionaminic acid synthase
MAYSTSVVNPYSVIGVVIARAGSKGVPNKNIRPVGGIPLVSHIIQSAVTASALENMDLVLSTDCEEIRELGIRAGALAPFLRPASLAGDDVESLPVVQHCVNFMELYLRKTYDAVVYLQPTAPLCRPEDIAECVRLLKTNLEIQSAVTITQVATHPFKMKRLLSDGRLVNFIEQGFEDMRPRQQLPPVFRRAGSVYASRRDVVMLRNSLVGDPCLGVVVPPKSAIDIDSEIDLILADIVYRNLKAPT